MNVKFRGFLALLATSFFYGSFGIVVRTLNPYLTGNQMTFFRSIIVFLVIGIFLIIKKTYTLKVRKELWIYLFIHSATFTATLFLFTYSVLLTSLSKSTFSFYSTTLITSLLVSVFIFKEEFSMKKGVSLILAFSGLIFFILPDGIKSIGLGMVLTGIAGINDVVTNSMKKYLGGKVESIVLVFYQMLAGSIGGILLIIFSQQYTFTKPLDIFAIIWILVFALGFFLLSSFVVYGFQHFDLNLGTIILSLELVWATLIGYFLFQETLNIYQIIAMGLITLSIVAMNWPSKKSELEASHQPT